MSHGSRQYYVMKSVDRMKIFNNISAVDYSKIKKSSMSLLILSLDELLGVKGSKGRTNSQSYLILFEFWM